MIVEPTGVVFEGRCEIQSDACVARDTGTITAVWASPGREQINVCRPCLTAMVRAGEWSIPGARIPARADLAVLSDERSPVLVVEVKRRPEIVRDPLAWGRRVRRNLLVHGGISFAQNFLLAAVPGPFMLWLGRSAVDADAAPDHQIEPDPRTRERLRTLYEADDARAALETAVREWLEEALRNLDQNQWLLDLRGPAALSRAHVVAEYAA